jgi:hypothetical protein
MTTMPTVAIEADTCRITSVSPVPKTYRDCEQGQEEHGEGVQPEDHAHASHHVYGECQHGYPFSTAQGLVNR